MIRLSLSFRARGLQRFIEGISLEAFTDRLEEVLRERGLRTFRRNLPRRTGDLRRSLRLERKGNTITIFVDPAIAGHDVARWRWRRRGPVGFPHVQQILDVTARRNLKRWIDEAIRRQNEALQEA